MKRFRSFRVIVWWMLLTVFVNPLLKAQLLPASVKEYLNIKAISSIVSAGASVSEFYKACQYNSAWITNNSNRFQLIQLLASASELGLNEKEYQYGFIQSARQGNMHLKNLDDSLEAEIRFSDAALHFFTDITYGSFVPLIGHNGLNYLPGCKDIPALLAVAVEKNNFTGLIRQTEPVSPEYVAVKTQLATHIHLLKQQDSAGKAETKASLSVKQRLKRQEEELRYALNTLRWLECTGELKMCIVVNVPSAVLRVYEQGKIILESRVIVGKRSTPTPLFTSRVTDVVLYPYWNVPKKIAVKELLPLIRKDVGYLSANNMQVLNLQGRVVKPSSISWNTLSASDFPYVLRQSTGCDNSLGLVKLNLYTPYGVYLHDTPWKSLFSLNKRYFSHGCIRVEKAMELAHLLLGNNTIAVDTLEEKGCLRNQSPLYVPAMEKVPVFVLYNTAWTDSTGSVRFYEDVYRKYPLLLKRS